MSKEDLKNNLNRELQETLTTEEKEERKRGIDSKVYWNLVEALRKLKTKLDEKKNGGCYG